MAVVLCSLRTATKVNEMLGNVDASSALSAFEKMEEKVLAMESQAEALGQLTSDDLEGKVPFYLAELAEKIAQDDRIQILKASQTKLKEFISFCEAMELVPKEVLESYTQGASQSVADQRIARFKRQRAAGSKLLEIKEQKERRGHSTKAVALSTPVETREEEVLDDDGEEEREIARFKRHRAAESKLLEIKEQKERRGHSTKAAALSTPVEAGEEEVLDDDGEEEREALDLLEMLKKEEEMLSAVKDRQSKGGDKEFSRDVLDERAKKAEAWHRDTAVPAQYTKPSRPITCATFAQDVLEGRAEASQAHEHKHQPLIFAPASLLNGSLTTERERMAAQVFQPGHRLPTMSIEEAGLREMEIMNKWQEKNARLMEEANSSWYKDRKSRPGEDDDEDDDAAQEKARAWDDWKDDNPRGAGNKKLTPCG